MTVPSRPIAPDPKYEVAPLELFFDLVFVFAVSQLSQHLRAHLSWRGAAETLVMLLGLFMNAAVTRAFTNSGSAFVIPLLLIQLGRTFWTLANSPNAVFRDHFFRTLLWFVATSPLWIAGAAVDPETRLLCWALAAATDQIGAWLAHPIPGRRLRSENIGFAGGHMLERCRLFLIVALGETVLRTGIAVAAAPMRRVTLVTGTVALAGTVALWALSFGRPRRLTDQHLEETRDPVRAARHAVHGLMGMVAGLIAVAVANEMVIAHPDGDASLALSLLLYGGPILYLVAQGWYLWAVPGVFSRLRPIGSAALALVGLATLTAPPSVALILAGATLWILAVLDRRADVAATDASI